MALRDPTHAVRMTLTLYPPGTLADNLELETLALKLEKRYGIDFQAFWREDITLGELYEQARARVA